MPAEPEVFTLEAANALVPKLSTIVKRQLSRRASIESRLKSLAEIVGEIPNEIAPDDDDPATVRTIKLDLVDRITEYQEGWREIEDLGAVVKDPRAGLLDFYGQVDGKLVWLCWKYGEPEIGHYHALDEGFSARRPLRNSIRTRLLN